MNEQTTNIFKLWPSVLRALIATGRVGKQSVFFTQILRNLEQEHKDLVGTLAEWIPNEEETWRLREAEKYAKQHNYSQVLKALSGNEPHWVALRAIAQGNRQSTILSLPNIIVTEAIDPSSESEELTGWKYFKDNYNEILRKLFVPCPIVQSSWLIEADSDLEAV